MDADGRRRAAAIQKEHRLAGLGSSDAHSEDVLGVCYTDFDANIASTADLVAAIRARKATAYCRQ
jgi:PHP family Zn ribbon phosphoesterase